MSDYGWIAKINIGDNKEIILREVLNVLIDEIIKFCDNEYSCQDTSHVCRTCGHKNGCPSDSCKKCLEEIHYPLKYPDGKKDYDCPNLINFYVCDYSYKYASEIWYLLKQSETLKSIEKYHILSIGCGGCPDLMAFESFLKESGEKKTISYLGIDKNELWKPVHEQIEQYENDTISKVRFKYEDAIEYFNQNIVSEANVLILQYIISHFYNTNQITKIDEFYDNLIESIILHRAQKKPFVILINDVNSNNRGRDFFLDFAKKLAKSNLHGTYSQYYFDYHIQNDCQRYGTKHARKHILYGTIPKQLEKYEPWEKCSSAQLLIEIVGGENNDN